MSLRTTTALGLVGLLLAGGATAPTALAAKPKPKPKPITETYTATAMPDPTSTNPVSGEICAPTLPTAKFSHTFKVPAKGTLFVDLQNTLDWSVAIRDSVGDTLATADGSSPEVKESTSVSFKKKQTVTIDTCNFAGEPTVEVKVKFVYK